MTSSKQALMLLLTEMFELITPLVDNKLINKKDYLAISDQFHRMNIPINKIEEITNKVRKNKHYKKKAILARASEKEKVNNDAYMLCSCGSFIKKHIKNRFSSAHIKTDKHYKLLRAKRLVYIKKDKDIDFEIKREILIEALTLKHILLVQEGERMYQVPIQVQEDKTIIKIKIKKKKKIQEPIQEPVITIPDVPKKIIKENKTKIKKTKKELEKEEVDDDSELDVPLSKLRLS